MMESAKNILHKAKKCVFSDFSAQVNDLANAAWFNVNRCEIFVPSFYELHMLHVHDGNAEAQSLRKEPTAPQELCPFLVYFGALN